VLELIRATRSAVRRLLLALLLLTPIEARAERSGESGPVTPANRQAVVVRSSSWRAQSGTLERYARNNEGGWVRVGAEVPVMLGRSGMAWGRGLHMPLREGPRKREGDGKSPAGVFLLERAFGVATALPVASRDFPYFQTQDSSYCVEDVRSRYYNQLIDSNDVPKSSWQRWSPLRRTDGLFEWGIVVTQNSPEIAKAAGSCVFLHVWRGEHRPTSGCTAMPRDELEVVLRWLDRKAKPVLVQLPTPVFDEQRAEWALP
jgi:L,D-peptidoglycan transpeptidase YkuD (ErfK/YbiS/YcfS/YnhG family)